MAIVQLQAPAKEPILLADAKNHLRIDSDITQDDALISMLISAARRYGETRTGRSWITQKWRLRLDGFARDCFGAGGGMNVIELERGKVQSVDAITYLDMGSVQRTMDLALVAKDLDSLPARVSPVFGQVWPVPLPQIGAVSIDYTAGYGPNEVDVPEGIRQWMLVRLATLYEHREEVEVVARGKVEAMPFVDSLLDPYTVVTL
jgi:uncharacterized phiE125 gp8 family phage protein